MTNDQLSFCSCSVRIRDFVIISAIAAYGHSVIQLDLAAFDNVKFILFLSLPLYALDQLTKHWVLRSISPYDARIVVPDFFNLVNVTNTAPRLDLSRATTLSSL